MKPPVRSRTAPIRYGVESDQLWTEIDSEISDWTTKDKRLLLRALMRQSWSSELDLAAIEQVVPGKNEQEIAAYLDGLRVRAARSVIQRDYIQRLQTRRRKEQQLRAPLQIWTELAEEATGTLDEGISTAFSQTLMIAATEPSSQEHSTQRVELPDRTSTDLEVVNAGVPPNQPIPESGSSTQTGGSPVTSLGATSPGELRPQDIEVDFGKIYKFLSAAVRGSALPQLSPIESAVVLDLLMTLPDQLQELSCRELRSHLNLTYSRLNRSRTGFRGHNLPEHPLPGRLAMDLGTGPHSPQSTDAAPTRQPPTSGSDNQLEPAVPELPTAQTDQSESTHAPESIQSEPRAEDVAVPSQKKSNWLAACPLNPFVVPVRLLVRRKMPASSQGSGLTSDSLPGPCADL